MNLRTLLPKPATCCKSPTTKSIKKPTRRYSCGYGCKDEFLSHRSLKTHELQFHKKIIPEDDPDAAVICDYCCCLLDKTEKLNHHISTEHFNKNYVCFQCNINYLSKGYLQRHVRKVHNSDTLLYYCRICNKSDGDVCVTSEAILPNRLAVSSHFEEMHPASINEDPVDFEFLEEFLQFGQNDNSFQMGEWDEWNMNWNFPEILANDLEYFAFQCPKCCEKIIDMRSLGRHLANKHGTVYTKKGTMETVDKVQHLVEEFKCPFCGKFFGKIANMKWHMGVFHSNRKRLICQLCDAILPTTDHLKKHVQSKHNNERKHICEICGKQFIQLCHLKAHQFIHKGGKQLECDWCDKKFWRKIDLVRHINKKHT